MIDEIMKLMTSKEISPKFVQKAEQEKKEKEKEETKDDKSE